MYESILKYFFIILCELYIYPRLLNIKKKQAFMINLRFCMFSIFLSIFIGSLRFILPSITTIIMVTAVTIFLQKIYVTQLNESLITTVMATNLSYISFTLSAIFTSIFEYMVCQTFKIAFPLFLLPVILGFMQFLVVMALFRIRRFKSGMPFLCELWSDDAGILISFSLLFVISILGIDTSAVALTMLLSFTILTLGVIIWFWWKNRITKAYLKASRMQEIETLKATIAMQLEEIDSLKKHNEEIARLIHKDNKLIPAMELAVKEFLLTASQMKSLEVCDSKANEILSKLEKMTNERSGIIKNYDHRIQHIISTNVASIDILLSYINQRAFAQGIEFKFTLSGSIKYLVENIISEHDLETLLADLLENALIATHTCSVKKILLNITIKDSVYFIEVFDSGIPFKRDTLPNIGMKQFTTHADTGGSGIGLMNTFALCEKYHISFSIEEFEDMIYTKSISLCFGKK